MRFPRLTRFLGNPWVQDIALVAPFMIAGGFTLAYTLVRPGPVGPLSPALLLITSLPLVWRRRHPLAVAALVVALDVTGPLLTGPDSIYLGVQAMIALYSVGRYRAGRAVLFTGLAAGLAYATLVTIRDYDPARPLMVITAIVFSVLMPFFSLGIGQFVRLRGELKQRRQAEMREEAIRGERRRIARELHDVVAHHLSVINALVGGARTVLPPEPAEAREALEAAEQSARQALSEMRQLLQVLRADTADGPDAATGVGASRLPELIEKSGNASLRVHGEPVHLPTAIDHAVYRVVQEALTNTRKHAPGSRAGVRLAYLSQAVEVEVVDDGSPVKSAAAGSGFGLGGMAERVALCGGRLETGPRPRGGFRVYALLPLERA
ncbi:sensor histidine kinase [Nonomuraea typhae]|uniref:sensor histidine kinase n=1 Tax=Nonomuraea typhae TaxID=2603600 RepID=UPI0012FACA4D|nr:histidine kinase [Nonomuraea typhae]